MLYLHRMKRYAIIVAGGTGRRMRHRVPKQFISIHSAPLLVHTLRRFVDYDPAIVLIVVIHPEWEAYWEKLKAKLDVPQHTVVKGGEERFFSVKNGLAQVTEPGVVGIHDAVRPFVSIDTLTRCYTMAETYGNAIPVLPVTDSLREQTPQGNSAVDRRRYVRVQTPQCFDSALLLTAYAQPFDPAFTDDASVVERSGIRIHLTEGNAENIKITEQSDLRLAEFLLRV